MDRGWRNERLKVVKEVSKETGWNVYWSGANKERADEKNKILRERESSKGRSLSKNKNPEWGRKEGIKRSETIQNYQSYNPILPKNMIEKEPEKQNQDRIQRKPPPYKPRETVGSQDDKTYHSDQIFQAIQNKRRVFIPEQLMNYSNINDSYKDLEIISEMSQSKTSNSSVIDPLPTYSQIERDLEIKKENKWMKKEKPPTVTTIKQDDQYVR